MLVVVDDCSVGVGVQLSGLMLHILHSLAVVAVDSINQSVSRSAGRPANACFGVSTRSRVVLNVMIFA